MKNLMGTLLVASLLGVVGCADAGQSDAAESDGVNNAVEEGDVDTEEARSRPSLRDLIERLRNGRQGGGGFPGLPGRDGGVGGGGFPGLPGNGGGGFPGLPGRDGGIGGGGFPGLPGNGGGGFPGLPGNGGNTGGGDTGGGDIGGGSDPEPAGDTCQELQDTVQQKCASAGCHGANGRKPNLSTLAGIKKARGEITAHAVNGAFPAMPPGGLGANDKAVLKEQLSGCK